MVLIDLERKINFNIASIKLNLYQIWNLYLLTTELV